MKNVLFVFLLLSAKAYAADITAASCSVPDIQAAWNRARTGDVVHIPPTACISTVEISLVDKAATLMGDGIVTNAGTVNAQWKGKSTLTCNTRHCIVVKNPIGAGQIRITGLHLIWTAASETLIYNEAWNYRFDNLMLDSPNGALCSTMNKGETLYHYYASGLYDHNVFLNCRTLLRGETNGPRNEWGQPSTIGVSFDYVNTLEFNSFFFVGFGNAIDHEAGGRSITRRNYFQNIYLEVHGLQNGGSGPGEHGRSWELYENTFFCDAAHASTGQCYAAMRLRGGTGVSFSNTVNGAYEFMMILDNPRSDTNFGSPNGACNGTSAWDGNITKGWPCRDQIGRGRNQASEPAYFWNNSFKGAAAVPTVIGFSANVKPGGSGDDIKAGRDYFNAPRPAYTPLGVHPLSGTRRP